MSDQTIPLWVLELINVILVQLIVYRIKLNNEFFVMVADCLWEIFAEEVKNAMHVFVIIHTTPGESHVDQITVVLRCRYVQPNGYIMERSLFHTYRTLYIGTSDHSFVRNDWNTGIGC
jgi:hypothetical protein